MNAFSSRLSRPLLAGLVAAATIAAFSSFGIPTPAAKTLRILLDPAPASIVRVQEGDSFVVPTKLNLVVKAAGDANGFGMGSARIMINGASVLVFRIDFQQMAALPFPLVAREGDVVTVEEDFPDPNFVPYVTGYLSE